MVIYNPGAAHQPDEIRNLLNHVHPSYKQAIVNTIHRRGYYTAVDADTLHYVRRYTRGKPTLSQFLGQIPERLTAPFFRHPEGVIVPRVYAADRERRANQSRAADRRAARALRNTRRHSGNRLSRLLSTIRRRRARSLRDYYF